MTTAVPAAPIRAQRWLLPAAALVAAADRTATRLPAGVGPALDDDTRPVGLALLARGGGGDAAGDVAQTLAAGLAACRQPVATIELTVTAIEGASSPGRSWRAWYVIGDHELLTVVQRADTPLLEVAAGPPETLPGEIARLLPALLPTGAGVRAVRPTVVPIAALAQVPRDGADMTALAEATGTPTAQLLAAAQIAEQAQQALQVLVTGRPGADGRAPVDTLLWYRIHGGWLSVDPAPGTRGFPAGSRPVRIAPVEPSALPGRLAAMLAGALA